MTDHQQHEPAGRAALEATAEPPARAPGTRPALLVLIGPAGAGKSTYALGRACNDGAVVLSLDDQRAAVTGDPGDQTVTPVAVATWHDAIRDTLRTVRPGTEVIADATSAEAPHRRELVALAHEESAEAVAVLFRTPVYVAADRNARRTGTTRVPSDVLAWQHDQVSALTTDGLAAEGFDAVIELPVETTSRGYQHPNGGPVVGATECPHCHMQTFIDGECRECDWPG